MTETTQRITKEMFAYYMGREPELDDLDRCNCCIQGLGHSSCGWSEVNHVPVFMVGEANLNSQVLYPANTKLTTNWFGPPMFLGYLKKPFLLKEFLKHFLTVVENEKGIRSSALALKEHLAKEGIAKDTRDPIPSDCKDLTWTISETIRVMQYDPTRKRVVKRV